MIIMNNYNIYEYQYNNEYYTNIINERVKMVMNRDIKLHNQSSIKRLKKDYSLIEKYTDRVRLLFILGEPIIYKKYF